MFWIASRCSQRQGIGGVIAFLVMSIPAGAVSAASIAGSGCSTVFSSIPCLAQGAGNLFGLATAALIGIAIVIYFAGIIRTLFKAGGGNATSFADLSKTLGWGLVALFLVLSIWGIIRLLGGTLFGTNNFNSLW